MKYHKKFLQPSGAGQATRLRVNYGPSPLRVLELKQNQPIVIEGYASLFGERDLMGDVVRAGAFAQSLKRMFDAGGDEPPKMLLSHTGTPIGRWTTIREDGRGLFVRGLIEGNDRRSLRAREELSNAALAGLSIGFRPLSWKPRSLGESLGAIGSPSARNGRELTEIDLVEISLVHRPMAPKAKFRVV